MLYMFLALQALIWIPKSMHFQFYFYVDDFSNSCENLELFRYDIVDFDVQLQFLIIKSILT